MRCRNKPKRMLRGAMDGGTKFSVFRGSGMGIRNAARFAAGMWHRRIADGRNRDGQATYPSSRRWARIFGRGSISHAGVGKSDDTAVVPPNMRSGVHAREPCSARGSMSSDPVRDPPDMLIPDEVHVAGIIFDHENVFSKQHMVWRGNRISHIFGNIHAEVLEWHRMKQLLDLLSHAQSLSDGGTPSKRRSDCSQGSGNKTSFQGSVFRAQKMQHPLRPVTLPGRGEVGRHGGRPSKGSVGGRCAVSADFSAAAPLPLGARLRSAGGGCGRRVLPDAWCCRSGRGWWI